MNNEEKILNLLEQHNEKFDNIFSVLEEHNQKFDKIFDTLEQHNKKLEEHDARFDRIEQNYVIMMKILKILKKFYLILKFK